MPTLRMFIKKFFLYNLIQCNKINAGKNKNMGYKRMKEKIHSIVSSHDGKITHAIFLFAILFMFAIVTDLMSFYSENLIVKAYSSKPV